MYLRPARIEDALLLLEWRNDPDARREYFDDQPVTFTDHVAWLKRKLASGTEMLIAEVDEVPVGQVRIEDGAISYSVGKVHRRMGYGTQIIEAITRPGLTATVKASNIASRRTIEKAGWAVKSADDQQVVYAAI